MEWLKLFIEAVTKFLNEKIVIDGLDLAASWKAFSLWLQGLV
jgi:hypothetical protein